MELVIIASPTKEILGLDKVLDICGIDVAECARDLNKRICTSRYVFNVFGGGVRWKRKI